MSGITMEMLATIQAIQTAKLALVRISTPILFILGNFGEILNIIIFVQRIFRTNSCAIYFLAASCTRLFFINFTILLNDLTIGYNIDPAQTSVAFCKIKFYLSTVAAILPPSFVVLACLDRLMLSSQKATIRSWSQPRLAYRSIAGVSIFWILFSIHSLIGSTILTGPGYSYCYIQPGSYTLFVALYSVIIDYLLPPLLMIILGSLTIVNVRRSQRHIRPTAGAGYAQQKERHLLRMLLFQVLVNVIFTIPAGVFQLYGVISANWQKDPVWATWDLFFFVLVLTIFYIPNCVGFYIYTLTASIFRQELKRIIMPCYRRLFRQRQARVTAVTTTTTTTTALTQGNLTK